MTRLGMVALVFAAVMPIGTPGARPAVALSGCCKERGSYSSPWGRNGAGFEGCEQQNRQKDGDNVYDERGLVWWDARCS